MNCPKCEAAMEKVTHDLIEVDRCSQCKGIWFGMLEAEHLKDMKGSDAIDTGNPAVAKIYNEMKHVKCPVCHGEMIGMVDARTAVHLVRELPGLLWAILRRWRV